MPFQAPLFEHRERVHRSIEGASTGSTRRLAFVYFGSSSSTANLGTGAMLGRIAPRYLLAASQVIMIPDHA